MTTPVSEQRARLRIRPKLWSELVSELARRGGGHREAGAFLLGRRRGRRPAIARIVYFDDLEPGSLNGAVHLTTTAYSRLADICRAARYEVFGDIHTHPGSMVHQSHIDEDNPLVAQRGHIALIIGNYAQGRPALRDAGVYVYLGDDGWATRPGAVRHKRWF